MPVAVNVAVRLVRVAGVVAGRMLRIATGRAGLLRGWPKHRS
jgi:hypothetical protein